MNSGSGLTACKYRPQLQAGTGQNPVYYYSFRQKPPFPAGSVYEGWGASHFAELWYVFDHLNQEPWSLSSADREVAEEISSYWVNFARSVVAEHLFIAIFCLQLI
jgi:para-nitrobenzyl esterase